MRPYPPDFCDATTLAYRLDISRHDLDQRVKQGLLPPPLARSYCPGKRIWKWADVEAWIARQNGDGQGLDRQGHPGPATEREVNPFAAGVQRVKAAHG